MLIGDLVGYNEHHKWFGEKTKQLRTEFDGDLLKFGIAKAKGRDRSGLTALLIQLQNLIHTAFPASTVTNIIG